MFFNKCDPKVKDLLSKSRVLKNPLIKTLIIYTWKMFHNFNVFIKNDFKDLVR